jgi:hydroxymethylpyrimidine/phosphomethylpyrimidine kinase
MKNNNIYPAALTIAGSDSGGGAGIEADLRTFNAFGVFGTVAITAVTAQNPREVRRVDNVDHSMVKAQIDSVAAAIKIKSAKTGMLGTAETVEVVANAVKEYRFDLGCDPVMVSTSGAKLICDDGIAALKEKLLPVAAWITPNLPEAEMICNVKIDSFKSAADAAKMLFDRFGAAILLKTGHANLSRDAADIVVDRNGSCFELVSPKIDINGFSSHGTGCTLSAAIAAAVALEYDFEQTMREAKSFVLGSLREAVTIGKNIDAMYPPTEDCYALTSLRKLKR